jgi:restriction system protein
MPIPKYDELTWPILEILKDSQVRSTHELANILSDRFRLSEEERNALLPSGVQTYMLNRAGWAGFHLDRAGLVTRPKRGRWQITSAGLEVASGPPRKLDRQTLCEFPPFAEYLAKARAGKPNAAPGAQSPETAEITDADTPPEEQIANAFKTLRAGLKQDLLDSVGRMDPIKFERLVLDLLLAMGYGGSREEAASMTKASNDEGIDGVINEDRLGLDVIYVQAKRWQNTVGRKEIQSFVGALAGQQAHKGIFITTSDFADTARNYAKNIPQKVILLDGDRLADLMIQHNIGVSLSHAYEIKKIDSDYFEET